MFDLQIEMATPYILHLLCFEIHEQILSDGTVPQLLDEGEASMLAAQLRAAGVESLAVRLLHSYRDPRHERRLWYLPSNELPDVPISLSSDVAAGLRASEEPWTAKLQISCLIRLAPG